MGLFVKKHAELMWYLLRLTKERCLDNSEQTLGIEMARFMATLISATPLMARRFDHPKVQEFAITQCVNWLVDPICIRFFIGLVLYDLQLDTCGRERGSVSTDFVEKA